MNFLSNLLGLIPSRSTSNKQQPLSAKPSSVGCLFEPLENRRLLSATPVATIVPCDPTTLEGRADQAVFGIRLDKDAAAPLIVSWQIAGGTADLGDHTLPASGNVTIPQGKKLIKVSVQATDDALVEGDETLIIALTPGEGYAVGGLSSAELIVGDDDATPNLTLNGLSEGQEEGPGAILAVGADRVPLSMNLTGSPRFGAKATLSIGSGADKIKVWSAQTGGQLLLDATQSSKSWKAQELPSQVWIEAVSPSPSARDITLTLSFHASSSMTVPATDTVKVTTEPTIRLAWNTDDNGPGLYAFRIPLTGGQINPVPDGDNSSTFGDPSVSVDWGDGTESDDGTIPHFYEEGIYTITVTRIISEKSTTTTFSVTVADSPNPIEPGEKAIIKQGDPGVGLAWDSIDGAISYDVYRGLSDMMYLDTVTSTEYTDSDAVSEAIYYYQIIANIAEGDTVAFPVIAAGYTSLASATVAPTPPLITPIGPVTPEDEARAKSDLLTKGKAQAAANGDIFVALHDIVISAVIDANGRKEIAYRGKDTTITEVNQNANGEWIAPGGFATAEADLNKIANDHRAPVQDQGGGQLTATLQDGTVITVMKDGDWGNLTIQRAGEPVITIRYINPVRQLNFRGPGGLNGNIDRIDLTLAQLSMVEEKSAEGLNDEENKNPDGTKKLTEAMWAKNHVFDKMSRRLTDIQNATETFKDPKYVGPNTPPTIDQVKAIKNVVFEIQGNWPELQAAVNAEIQNLKNTFPNYTFSVKFGIGIP